MACEVNNKEINSQCAELLVRPTYIPCVVVISTALTLLSVCSVTIIVCVIHITAHFTAHEAQILIFWRMCSTFFVIKNG